MTKSLLNEVEACVLDIAQKVQSGNIFFIVKTSDAAFNNYLIKKLIEKGIFSSEINSNSLEQVLLSPTNSLPDKGIQLVDLFSLSDNMFVFIQERLKMKKQQGAYQIYLISNYQFQRLSGIEDKESFFSSLVFLSEYYSSAIQEVLKDEINLEKLPKRAVSQIIELLNSKTISLSKLIFFFSNNNLELENPDEGEYSWINELSTGEFLDNRGEVFLNQASTSIPLETIQAFFRGFIFVEASQAYCLELEVSEIHTYTQAPQAQLDLLIQLCIDPSYRLLEMNENRYKISIPEYVTEWKNLKRWITNEETAYKQFKQLEVLAGGYFEGTGTLLSKEQIDQALGLTEELFSTYNWEEKYKVDKSLLSSYVLLSQNNLDEIIKAQQKKRASLIKNSIRISIAVSIAFLVSSFTALLAYLERNSAIEQQEIAIQSKNEAEQARVIAEKERLEAIKARENEQDALRVAESERQLALDAKVQAESQRMLAIDALIQAKKSEQEASIAKDVAQKNAILANEAKITAQINFETSEKLRNQQEARATALEALGFFANNNYEVGIEMVRNAYQKNLSNGGFPLQSDIFNALLNGINTTKTKESEKNLGLPAKLLSLSKDKEKIAVYTINGELSVFSLPSFEMISAIKTGYLKSFEFLNSSELLGRDITGKLVFIDLRLGTTSDLTALWPELSTTQLFRAYGHENTWLAKNPDGKMLAYEYQGKNGFILKNQDKILAQKNELIPPLFWVEGSEFFQTSLSLDQPQLLYKAASPIHSLSWSSTHKTWLLGLENGQILSVDPTKEKATESFAIHATKVSQLVTLPYAHNTELMISTGFDGGLIFFVFDKNIPLSTSISSRIKFQGHRSWITGFTVDVTKKIAYSISNDRTLKVWPLEINELLQK